LTAEAADLALALSNHSFALDADFPTETALEKAAP
jgi:hypothetical protein